MKHPQGWKLAPARQQMAGKLYVGSVEILSGLIKLWDLVDQKVSFHAWPIPITNNNRQEIPLRSPYPWLWPISSRWSVSLLEVQCQSKLIVTIFSHMCAPTHRYIQQIKIKDTAMWIFSFPFHIYGRKKTTSKILLWRITTMICFALQLN